MCVAYPSSSCGPNASYNPCNSACPKTCQNPGPMICTMQCVPGCGCNEGFVAHNGQCIPSTKCPSNAGER